MSKITPPTLSPTATVVADDIYGTFYDVNGESYQVINGGLDHKNISLGASDASFASYNFVQQGALTGGSGVAGTANLDYFAGNEALSWLGAGHYTGVGLPTGYPNRYLPIPGASVQFYLPYDAYVLLTWSVTWTNDSCGQTADEQSSEHIELTDIALFIDGEHKLDDVSTGMKTTPYGRCVGRTMFGIIPAGTSEKDFELQDRYKSRVWSGHYFTNDTRYLKAGYHSASLRICQHNKVKQSRVRARSMNYMYFKYGDS